MAKIVVKVDAARAKRELDAIHKKVLQIGIASDKPIRPRVSPSFGGAPRGQGGFMRAALGRTVGGAVGSGIGGSLGGSIASGIGGAIGGGLGGGMIGAAFSNPLTAVAAAAALLVSQFEEVKDAFAGAGNQVNAFFNNGTVSADRAAKADELADRAAANGNTFNQQFAAEEARRNVFGVQSDSIFGKLALALNNATNGDTKVGDILADLGFNAQSFAGMSETQKQDAVLGALSSRFNEAQASGDVHQQAAVMAMTQELVGARNANEARQILSGTRFQEYQIQRDDLQKNADRMQSESRTQQILAANGEREFYDSMGRFQDYIVADPSEIVDHAQASYIKANHTTRGLFDAEGQRAPDASLTYRDPQQVIQNELMRDMVKNTNRTNELLQQQTRNASQPAAVYQ